ncbi:MAG: hypothetical protein AAB923_02155 [Patescibacteria group bacterium]
MAEKGEGPDLPGADSRDDEVRAIKRDTARGWNLATRNASRNARLSGTSSDEAAELAKKAQAAVRDANKKPEK